MPARRLSIIAAITASSAGAQVVSLDTGLLPTQQPGWSFVASNNDSGVSESQVFSTDGTTLTSNSMALPFASGRPASTFAQFDLSAVDFDEVTSVTIDLRARVLESEIAQFNAGFFVSMYGEGRGFSAGLSTTTITPNNQQNFALDTTQWRDYRWVADWTSETVDLFVDGQLLDTRNFRSSTGSNLNIGDGTGTANARAEIERFSLRIVPGPASASLLGIGALAALRRRR